MIDTSPAIYVGTYGKYNSGSLFGDWFKLEDYADKDDFYEAITEYHKKEYDPEFMFQDHEGIPDDMVGESWISDEFWDYMEHIDESYLDEEVFSAAAALGIPWIEVEDKYSGHFESLSDFGRYAAEGMEIPEHVESYFNYEAYGRDVAMDYSEHDGHYFSSY